MPTTSRARRPGWRARFARRLPDLNAGFWFWSSAVALLGPVLALIVIAIDKAAGPAGVFGSLIISPDSARTILGSIAGSLITIASLTSSLTIVTLQLLSSQYTPRTIRGFMATRLSQVVLGSFIAIFLFCLVTLVSVREPGDENDPFVPSLAVLVSLVLAVVGLILLVVFIHAMSQTIQISTMTARVSASTARAIAAVHGGPDEPADADDTDPAGPSVGADRTGYVRTVDRAALAEVLRGSPPGSAVHVLPAPGTFVVRGAPVAVVPDGWDGAAAVAAAVIIERERELTTDPAYGIRQLVDIALRALSPGINDPSTAVTCLGYLRGLLADVAARPLPARIVLDLGGRTVTVPQPRFDDYLDPVIECASYGVADARVVLQVLQVLDAATAASTDPDRRAALTAVRAEVAQAAAERVVLPRDRTRVVDGQRPGGTSR